MTSKKSAISSALEESIAKLVSDELIGRITATVLASLEGRTNISEADEDSHRLGYAKSGKDGFAVVGQTGGVPLKVVKQTPSESKNGNVVTIKPAKKTSKKSTPKPSKKATATPKESKTPDSVALLQQGRFQDFQLLKVFEASPRNAKFLCCSEGTSYGKKTGKACGAWFATKAKALAHKDRFSHLVTTKSSLREALAS